MSPSGEVLSRSLTFSIFNLLEAKESGTILFHHGDVTCLVFAGHEFLLSGGADGKLAVWKTHDWSKVRTIGSHKWE